MNYNSTSSSWEYIGPTGVEYQLINGKMIGPTGVEYQWINGKMMGPKG